LGLFGFPCIWFGYPVMRSNYIVFDYDRQRILAAPIHDIKFPPMKFDMNFYYLILFFSTLMIIIAVGALLNILERVSF